MTCFCRERYGLSHCTVPVGVVVGKHLAGDDLAVLLHQRQVSADAEPPLAAAKTTSPLPGVEVFAAMKC